MEKVDSMLSTVVLSFNALVLWTLATSSLALFVLTLFTLNLFSSANFQEVRHYPLLSLHSVEVLWKCDHYETGKIVR